MATDRAPSASISAATVASVLREAAALMAVANAIDSPELEARELLSALLEQPRSWPSLNGDAPIDGHLVGR